MATKTVVKSYHVTRMTNDDTEHKFVFALSVMSPVDKITDVNQAWLKENYPKKFEEPGLYLIHECKEAFHVHKQKKK